MLSCLSGGMVNMVVIHVKRIIVCIMSPSLHGKLDFGAIAGQRECIRPSL